MVLIFLYFIWPDSERVEISRVAEPTTSRLTTEGEYVGFVDLWGTRAWLGIPYATPPTGEHRWKAPTPPVAFTGTRTALDHGTPCIQLPNVMVRGGTEATSGVVGSEDCLYLNIWSPPNSINAPVMVWIHGGGNSTGEAATYNGATLASKGNVVVVGINYRLGLLGWFNHPSVLEHNQQRSGNFGTLDTIQALRWIRDNIRGFGGNPENVTVFGESAGGTNTLALLTTPSAKGLFHRAIVQSGSFIATPPEEGSALADDGGHTQSSSQIALKILVKKDLATDLSDAKEKLLSMSTRDLHQLFMKTSPAELYTTFENPGFGGMVDFPAIYADDVVIPSGDIQAIFSNSVNFHEVPVILGTNRDEPAIFMFQSPEFIDNLFGFLPRLKDEEDYRRVVHYMSQEWRIRGVDSIAKSMINAGHSEVYAYRFDWDEEPSVLGFDLSVALGAAHLLEVPFVFGNFDSIDVLQSVYPNDEAQTSLSNRMMSYWSEFAHTGSPGRGNSENAAEWLPFETAGQTSIVFDTDLDQGIRMIDGVVTYKSLSEELLADSFNDKDLHCRTYVLAFRERDIFSEAAYQELGCSHIPSQEVTW